MNPTRRGRDGHRTPITESVIRVFVRSVALTVRPLLPVVALALGLTLVRGIFEPMPRAMTKPTNGTGIRNFGRVDAKLYRGGDFVPHGVQRIVDLGVRTVISVRAHSTHGEPDSCAAHGIAYYLFPMTTHATPSSAAMDSILDIVRNASAPVFVHCTAGEHRTGTVCALYRIRVQHWSLERAWAEQEAYGFGPAEHHPKLFHFVYGDGTELNR